MSDTAVCQVVVSSVVIVNATRETPGLLAFFVRLSRSVSYIAHMYL